MTRALERPQKFRFRGSLNLAGGFSPSLSRSLGWTHAPSSSQWRSWRWPCKELILRSYQTQGWEWVGLSRTTDFL